MNATQSFEEFIRSTSPTIDPWGFLINLGLSALSCYLLSLIYIRYGRSLSNRTSFGRVFLIVGVTTMIIITIVKSSLALSLGLVGALSIVRFRTAIKEPEELAFLFLTIAIGLGFGAGQRLITMLGAGAVFALLAGRGLMYPAARLSNLYLIVGQQGSPAISLEKITETLKDRCSGLSLMRFDESSDSFEVAYMVQFDDYRQIEDAKRALRECSESITVSFVNNDGIM